MYYGKYNAYITTKKTIKQQGLYRDHEEKNTMTKCDILIKKYPFITQEAFNSRRAFLCAGETGYLTREREPVEVTDPMAQMQGMMEGMKGSLPFIIASVATISWINYTFGSTLLAKVPFNLSQEFKTMTQSGIEMENLSVQYISGISFYCLIMFGLGQLNMLLMNSEEEMADAEENKKKQPLNAGQMEPGKQNPMMPMMPMNPMMPMGQQQTDASQKKKDMFKSQI
jgi:hypothetical protein